MSVYKMIAVMMLYFVIIAISASAESIKASALEFEQKETSVIISPNKSTPFHFNGKNISSHEVTIKQVKGSCGCVEVKASQMHLNPGETFEISGTVKSASSVSDIQKNSILIDSDSSQEVLHIFAKVERTVSISSKLLTWTSLNDNSEKHVQLTVSKDLLIEDLFLKYNNTNVNISQNALADSNRMDLTIAPRDGWQSQPEVVRIYSKKTPDIEIERIFLLRKTNI